MNTNRITKTILRIFATTTIIALAYGAVSCSRDSDPTTPNNDQATGTIGVGGGELGITSTDGIDITLAFPAGAVSSDQEFTIQALAPTDSMRVGFRLEPAGVILRQPVQLSIALPPGEDFTDWALYQSTGDHRFPQYSEINNGVLSVELWNTGLGDPLAEKDFADLFTQFKFEHILCLLDINNLIQAFDGVGDLMSADVDPSALTHNIVMLINTIRHLFALCLEDFEAAKEALVQIACDSYNNTAQNVADLPPPESAYAMRQQVARVISSGAMAVATGTEECANDNAPSALVGTEMEEFIAAYGERVLAPGHFQGLESWNAMWDTLFEFANNMMADAQALGNADVEEAIYTKILDPIYTLMHTLALKACEDDHNQSYLADLVSSGWYLREQGVTPSPEAAFFPTWSPVSRDTLLHEIQHCGSSLTVKVYDGEDVLLSTTELGPDQTSAEITVSAEGRLEFIGPVWGFWCTPQDGASHFSDEELVFRVHGEDVKVINRAGDGTFVSETMTMTMDEIKDASPYEYSAGLKVHRVGTACGGWYAEGGDTLYEVELSWQEDPGGIEHRRLLAENGGDGDSFGYSVAIDGNIAIVGAHLRQVNGFRSGSAFICNTITGQQIHELTANDEDPRNDEFGTSVAISGNTAIVGAPERREVYRDTGAAYLFDVSTGQQIHKLLPDDIGGYAHCGTSVGISGNWAIVGAPHHQHEDGRFGGAYIFDADSGQEIRELLPTDGPSPSFGYSVAISGNIAIVGAYKDNDYGDNTGSAYLFDVTTGRQIAKLLPNDGASGKQFGYSVAISNNTAIVGANYQGSAYLFDTATGQQIGDNLVVPGEPNFGQPVAISGNIALVGRGDNQGFIYIFDTNTGQQTGELNSHDWGGSVGFGLSVGVSGSTVIIGDYNHEMEGIYPGAASIFYLDESL